ncbi:phage replication protein [Neisseria meningitidis]|nr:phage replication protein [Neisseria meningitidis]CWU54896.1 phage replication protein [Neisseria meningitidis]
MSEAEYFSHFISNGNGKLLEIPQRRGRQDGVFIDWLSFTLHEDSLYDALYQRGALLFLTFPFDSQVKGAFLCQ